MVEINGFNDNNGQAGSGKVGLFQSPPAIERYRFVQNSVQQINETDPKPIVKIADLGCGGCELMGYLKRIHTVQMIFALDQCKYSLYNGQKFAGPNAVDFFTERPNQLVINLFRGSMLETDRRFGQGDIDLVTCIEAIEHIPLEDVPKLTNNIFGHIRPRYAIVSTPNFEYNKLIQEAVKNTLGYQLHGGGDDDNLYDEIKSPYRVHDHHFEWTRAEFKDWCDGVRKTYQDYDYRIEGIGLLNGDDGQRFGHCTQAAIFTRKDNKETTVVDSDDAEDDHYDIYEKPKGDKRYEHYKSYKYWEAKSMEDYF